MQLLDESSEFNALADNLDSVCLIYSMASLKYQAN